MEDLQIYQCPSCGNKRVLRIRAMEESPDKFVCQKCRHGWTEMPEDLPVPKPPEEKELSDAKE